MPRCAARRARAPRDEIDRYLGTHFGPGIAETRALIAAWREMAGSLPPGRTNPVVDAWMEAALAELAPAMPSLAAAIGAAVPHLDWITYDLYPPDEIGPAFARGHAFATLVGEGAPFPAEEFDLGIFIVAPDVLYRDHHHPAPELYAPLTGPHGWRFGGAGPLTIKAAHVPVWNDPGTVHLTKVGPSPFLSLFAWTQDVTLPAQVFPAQDWAELEALRIET